ncbi:MAG: RHS repeat protein [Chloroflexi bacterium]|nr:RHS repeat protein [Chloroflexota bacterium]
MKFGSGLTNTVKTYYDKRGRVVRVDYNLDGQPFTISTTYDDMDRVLTITHPNGEVVTYGYGDHGLPVSLVSSLRGTIVSNASYNALGKPVSVALGNGLTTDYQYWGVEYRVQNDLRYGLLRSIITGGLQSLTYNYDAKGNVSQLSDNNGHGGETIDFGYDHLDRLLSASAPIGESYAYNAIGNLTSKGGVSRTYPVAGQPRPPPPTEVGGQAYGYDANGNLLTAEGRTYGYDLENRLESVSAVGGLPARSFLYDGDGTLRRMDVGGNPTTRYVTGDYLVDIQTGEATVCYRFGGRTVAWRNNTQFRYLLTDHLGSTRGEANAGQSEAGQRRYYPFGGDRAVSGANDLGQDERYTGQRRFDGASAGANKELYCYSARWCLPYLDLFSQG